MADVPARLVTLTTDNLPVLFGTRSEPLAGFNITSTLAAGHSWVAWLLGAALTTMLIRLISVGLRRSAVNDAAVGSRTSSGFAAYLILVGAQALVAHAVVSGGGGMLIRYTLLGVLLPIGVTAIWLRVETARSVRLAVIAMLVVTGATALVDHARLAVEYRWRRPPNIYRELAETLILNGASSGRADYWVAYYVSFLTAERVVLEPTAVSRIVEYRDRVAADSGGSRPRHRNAMRGGPASAALAYLHAMRPVHRKACSLLPESFAHRINRPRTINVSRSPDRVGPYEIVSPLGTGGMGEVYRARDSRLNREVAIKVLLPARGGDPTAWNDSAAKRSCSPHSTIRISAPSTVSKTHTALRPWSWSWLKGRHWPIASPGAPGTS